MGSEMCIRDRNTWPLGISNKAGKGIRTLDIQLGKLTLYQLSYARVSAVSLSIQLSAFMHPCTNRALRQGQACRRNTRAYRHFDHFKQFLELP